MPPGVLPVGTGAKPANPHAAFTPAIIQKTKPKKRRKNPGAPPPANRYLNPQSKSRGAKKKNSKYETKGALFVNEAVIWQ